MILNNNRESAINTNHSVDRFPEWLNRKITFGKDVHKIKSILRRYNLRTVCEEARCPNISMCMSRNSLTFMILGKSCTRNCVFCNVMHSSAENVDTFEPANIACVVKELNIKHVIITSVTRDDLDDGGAFQFVSTINELKQITPKVIIEILTPDFKGNVESSDKIIDSKPDIFGHNIETVPSLYPVIRPKADYNRSLSLLAYVSNKNPTITVKSGLMAGLGEKKEEVMETILDLKKAGCSSLTIGQYLRPSKLHYPVKEYIHPSQFVFYQKYAEEVGIKKIKSGPYVRSSYILIDDFQ